MPAATQDININKFVSTVVFAAALQCSGDALCKPCRRSWN